MPTFRALALLALVGLPWLLLFGDGGVVLYGLLSMAVVLACIARDLLAGRAP